MSLLVDRLGASVRQARVRRGHRTVADEVARIAAAVGVPAPPVRVERLADEWLNGGHVAAAFVDPDHDGVPEAILLNADVFAEDDSNADVYARAIATHEAAHWLVHVSGDDDHDDPHGDVFRAACERVRAYSSMAWPMVPDDETVAQWPQASVDRGVTSRIAEPGDGHTGADRTKGAR